MKLLVMAGLISVVAAPAAFATEETNGMAVSERHVGAQARADQPFGDTDVRQHKDTFDPAVAATAPPRQHARKHPRTIEAGVPDSVLIGDTGAL